MSRQFVTAIAHCLWATRKGDSPATLDKIKALVTRVMDAPGEREPSKQALDTLQQEISSVLPSLVDQQVALVYGGATKIKEYVFEATKLPEIRGASALLEWVNDTQSAALWAEVLETSEELKTIAADPQQYIIYASGGNVLGFAPAAQGAQIATAIERCYTRYTLTAKSVAVSQTFHLLELRYGRLRFTSDGRIAYWVEDFLQDWQDARKHAALQQYYYPPDASAPDDNSEEARRKRFFNRKKFGELVTVLAAMSNQRRDERQRHGEARQVPAYALLPWAEKCDSSDIRPAVYRGIVGDEQREYSEASARKRVIGQELKDESNTAWFDKHFAWPGQPAIASWEQRWLEHLAEEGKDSPYAQACTGAERPPKDLDAIGAASDGYIGMIYADGNNVGRVIARLATPGEYADTSAELDKASKEAVFAALSRWLKPHNNRHPFEILTIGGDDMLLIVPGKAAFDIALEMAVQFERALVNPKAPASHSPNDRYHGHTERAQPFTTYTPEIGLSAGVVIARQDAPVFFLRDLVEELLKGAKKLARQRATQKKLGGAVDFMVLKSLTMVTDNIANFRKEALGEDSRRRLTARPYTWHEFAGLLATARALQQEGFPRSQLYRLRQVMEQESNQSILASTMEYLYTRVRLKRGNVLQKQIEAPWQPAKAQEQPQRLTIGPWLPRSKTCWETIWSDIVEIYDMVKQDQHEQGRHEQGKGGGKDDTNSD